MDAHNSAHSLLFLDHLVIKGTCFSSVLGEIETAHFCVNLCFCFFLSSFPELWRSYNGRLCPGLSCCVKSLTGLPVFAQLWKAAPEHILSAPVWPVFLTFLLMHSVTVFPVLPFVIPWNDHSTKGSPANVWWHNSKSMSQLRREWRTGEGMWLERDYRSVTSPCTGNQLFKILFLEVCSSSWDLWLHSSLAVFAVSCLPSLSKQWRSKI